MALAASLNRARLFHSGGELCEIRFFARKGAAFVSTGNALRLGLGFALGDPLGDLRLQPRQLVERHVLGRDLGDVLDRGLIAPRSRG
jgi:hypothetical protein